MGNLLFILLKYALAVQLLGRSDETVLRSPLLISENHTFDNLDAVQTTLLAGGLHLSKNNAVELLIMAEIFEAMAFNTVTRGKGLEGRLGRDDNGNGLVLVLSSVDANVADNGSGAVDGFELGIMCQSKKSAGDKDKRTFSRAMYSPFSVLTRFFLRSIIRS